MLEIQILTTDNSLVDDLNSVALDGVRAEYRPTLAFDSTEYILQIVIGAAAPAALSLAAHWLADRFKNQPPKRLDVNGQTIKSPNSIIAIVNIYVETKTKE